MLHGQPVFLSDLGGLLVLARRMFRKSTTTWRMRASHVEVLELLAEMTAHRGPDLVKRADLEIRLMLRLLEQPQRLSAGDVESLTHVQAAASVCGQTSRCAPLRACCFAFSLFPFVAAERIAGRRGASSAGGRSCRALHS